MNNEELLTRRLFFKKATQRILPMIGTLVAAPTIISTTLTSCGDSGGIGATGCYSCESACMDNCSSSSSNSGTTTTGCNDSCSHSCTSACTTTCQGTCTTTCEGTCEGNATGRPTSGDINGHSYVDLGLSVLWATCDLGANSEYSLGEKFYFADPDQKVHNNTTNKNEYYWENYYKALNIQAGESIIGTKYDAARQKWGNKWRMPSKNEFDELIANCDMTSLSDNAGFLFKSKRNGKSISLRFDKDSTITHFWCGDTDKGSSSNDNPSIYIFDLNAINQPYGYNANAVWKWPGSSAEFVSCSYSKNRIRPVIDRIDGTSYCNGSCAANCSSDCTSTCKNTCDRYCQGACGKDCTGGCKTECTGNCTNTCIGKCTANCADSCNSNCNKACNAECADTCKAQTSQTCSYCANNCSSLCTEACASECKAQTSQGCSNCATLCSGQCNNGCSTGCYGACRLSCALNCKGKCGNNCYVECIGIAKLTYCASCGRSCSNECEQSCTYDCYSTCRSVGRS